MGSVDRSLSGRSPKPVLDPGGIVNNQPLITVVIIAGLCIIEPLKPCSDGLSANWRAKLGQNRREQSAFASSGQVANESSPAGCLERS